MILSFLRTALLYLVLVLAVRLMGKRQIGQMEASEFVVTMLVANLAAIPMQDGAIPLYSGLVPILTVLGAELVLSGLILLIVPDSASVIIAYLTAGFLILSGIVVGIGALLDRRVMKGICALVCLSVGGTLIGNPLLLARNIGRFLSVLLAMEGGTCLRKGNSLWGAVLLITALVLCFAPLFLSRLLFSLMGLVVLLIGIGMLVTHLKNQKKISGGDSNIIDAL